MAVSDKLFDLIKSLAKQEKVYFKTYAGSTKNSNKKYILLFDAIASQKEYDSEKIKLQFKNERFVKQLPVAKDYLFKMIMKSLRNYDDFNPPVHIALKQMLHDINILYDKALYHSCEKVIIKAKKIAQDIEHFFYLSSILDWEKKILLSTEKNLESRNSIQNILTIQIAALEKEKNLILFRDLNDNLSAVASTSLSIRDKEKMETINSIMSNPLLGSIDNAMSFLSKLHFYNSHHLYNKLLRKRPESYFYSSCALKLFELKEYKKLLLEYKERYCTVLLNVCIDLAWLKKEEEFYKIFHRFRNFVIEFPELKTVVFPRTYIAQSLLYENTGKFDNVSLLADNFEKELGRFKGEISKERLMIVYYNFSCLYIMKQDYKETLRWLNKVLNDTTKELLKDVYCTARILNLIVHYELGNTELLESLTRSTYRYLLQQKSLYKFEAILIRFIRIRLSKVNSHEKLIEAFKELKKEFVILSLDEYEKPIIDVFDFISWLESKIENRSFTEIVIEKARKAIS